ncbi:hypothetical protein COY95_05115 [Candidatus Woesearchaeota archaeon CG_4_10_14_0_8_um_filter_47_5]|nr:MAG: hypothetical protein COY95_05115 [Candidatus Woesearchaeota archaeon CG_4_10_14_0_8_um_filter_47_5]
MKFGEVMALAQAGTFENVFSKMDSSARIAQWYLRQEGEKDRRGILAYVGNIDPDFSAFGVISISFFLDAIRDFDPRILREVEHQYGEIRDLEQVPGQYSSSFAAYVLIEKLRAVLKIKDSSHASEYMWFVQAQNHPRLRGIMAPPVGGTGAYSGLSFMVTEDARYLAPGYETTGFEKDLVLHMMAAIARVHAWGMDLVSGHGGLEEIALYEYPHPSLNIGKAVNAGLVRGRTGMQKATGLYLASLKKMQERGDVVVDTGDNRFSNYPNGICVDGGSVRKTYAECGIARALMDAVGLGLIEPSRAVFNYYLQWYNVLRTSEEYKRLGEGLGEGGGKEGGSQNGPLGMYVTFVTLEDLANGMQVDGRRYWENSTRDRPWYQLDAMQHALEVLH